MSHVDETEIADSPVELIASRLPLVLKERKARGEVVVRLEVIGVARYRIELQRAEDMHDGGTTLSPPKEKASPQMELFQAGEIATKCGTDRNDRPRFRSAPGRRIDRSSRAKASRPPLIQYRIKGTRSPSEGEGRRFDEIAKAAP